VQPSQQRFSMFMDSSSDSAGSSDAEYSEGDVLESTTKGEVVKEGFLMKKVIYNSSNIDINQLLVDPSSMLLVASC